MYKVIIDKKFLNFELPGSKGLISGLKKLNDKGFLIELEGYNPADMKILNKILASENISISDVNVVKEKITKTFRITSARVSLKDNSSDSGVSDTDLAGLNFDEIIVSNNGEINSFEKAALKLISLLRSSSKERNTKETKIRVNVLLDGNGNSKISTGVGFFDHMLEQIAKHANLNLDVNVNGDLFVDEHHTVEDTGITLGMAINEALGDKKGIKRYGFFLPMDESVAKCAIDLGGRNVLNFKCRFNREKVGDFPTELTEEFFRGLASGLKANIYLRAKGKNDHHKIEALFKSFAKALNEACRIDERNQNTLPSTKGIL